MIYFQFHLLYLCLSGAFNVWWAKLWKCFLKPLLLVKSGPCKKTTTSASILRGDTLIANLVTNSWWEAMKNAVQIKVLSTLMPLPALIGMMHISRCKNISDNKCCYQTNRTWWPLQTENTMLKTVFLHRCHISAIVTADSKEEKKEDYKCESYLRGLFNKANYHSVSNGIKLMGQRC